MKFDFRFGIEEEYFLVHRATGAACAAPPSEFWTELKERVPQASKELLQSQVEAKTSPCRSASQSLAELVASRAAIDDVARAHGLGLIAAGTHPDFDWRESQPTYGERYAKLARDMRVLARRNMYCGLHVHVEVPDAASRIGIMNRCGPYLPLFLALSLSSPIWRGRWTGMRGYRLTGYDELPRTGLPPVFASEGEFDCYVAALTRAGAIADASFLWWAIRPSLAFPTIELRICDSVTDVASAVAIASLYRCLIRRLSSDARFGATPSPLLRAIAEENRWQIQCDGLDAVIIDIETMEPTGTRIAIRKLMSDLSAEADALGCIDEFAAIDGIMKRGTSADRQIDILHRSLDSGASDCDAVQAVLDWLLEASNAE